MGDSIKLAGGTINSWIEVDSENIPLRIGLNLDKSILSNLPSFYLDIPLNLPLITNDSLFRHIYVNWNPGGHIPAGIYGLPHFDFHFYIISSSERNQITGGYDDVPVSKELIPIDYDFIPQEEYMSVPQMGVHYADSLSAEFKGEIFTRTLIYGFNKGKMIFVEPMITRDYLLNVVNEVIPIKQPERYLQAGYYPTNYEVNNSVDDNIEIILRDLVYHSSVTGTGTPVQLSGYELFQNYPNPFNPGTTINFNLPEKTQVKLSIFNLIGEEVGILLNEEKEKGYHKIIFNAEDFVSGVYFYKLQTKNYFETKKMILMK